MPGIYFHIPFCKRFCAYCDFYKSARTALLPATLEAMRHEVVTRRDYLRGGKVETIYFGGGTPSLCSAAQIGDLLRAVREHYDCSALAEVTLEANPDDLDRASLCALREAGINRLSIGIQSTDDGCLKLMNRRHNARQALEAVAAARAAGINNISVDLIFGVPGFGGTALQKTIDDFLALRVDHISAYHLTIEPDTAFGRRAARGDFRAVDEAVSEAEYAEVHRRLTEAGYDHYEISNYALADRRSRHNAAYWHDVPYLGIGPAAHSFDGEERHWNVASVERYLAGEAPECEHLTPTDRHNEFIMARLRTAEGFTVGEFAERFGATRTAALWQQAAPFLTSGALVASTDPEAAETADYPTAATRLRIPAERFLIADAVIEALFAL